MLWTPPDHGLDVIVLSSPSWSGGVPLFGGAAWVLGWCLTATVGAAAAVVSMVDGFDPLAELVALVRIPADTTAAHTFSMPGFPVQSGLFLSTGPAPVAGSVLLGVPR